MFLYFQEINFSLIMKKKTFNTMTDIKGFLELSQNNFIKVLSS